MNQPTHTIITLGPLVTTIMKARSTKAVWAASYLFSRIMKELLDAVPARCEILLPYHSDAKHDDLRAGLYPDQSVIKGDCLSDLQTAKAKILDGLTDQIYKDLSNRNKTQNRFPELYRDQQLKTQIDRFLKEYLQINLLSAAVGSDDKAVEEMTDLLNTAELRQMPLLHAEPDYLLMVFEEVFYNFLVKEKYFDARHDYFPSTAEIATYGLKDRPAYRAAQKILRDAEDVKNSPKRDPDAQIRFYQEVKASFPEHFRNHQKYIAIVQADGDNFGKIIKAINQLQEDQTHQNPKEKVDAFASEIDLNDTFSIQLDKFRQQAVKAIQDWQAVPVYGSGDDLLFFAPVAKPITHDDTKNGVIASTIFDLMDTLDEIFASCISRNSALEEAIDKLIETGQPIPTLSYGLSISYYKFPMNESLPNAYDLLTEAKKQPGKNSVAFRIKKHSGQEFGTQFNKGKETFRLFKNLLRKDGETVNDQDFLRSITFKIDPLKPLLESIGQSETALRNQQMTHLFDEHFNEAIHRDPSDKSQLSPFMQEMLSLLQTIYSENTLRQSKEDDSEKISERNQQNISKLYSALSLISFIHNKEERDEF